MNGSTPLWLMVAAMALVTYLIRAVPFVLFRRRIRSRFVRSLLSYMPYAVLSAVTIPAFFSATGNVLSSLAGCAAAAIAALRGRSLLIVAVCASAAALAVELLLPLLGAV